MAAVMTDALVGFLRGRLNEDEGTARGEITRREVWERKLDQMRRVGEMIGVGLVDFEGPGAPGDPARALAEVEAKRQIINLHEPTETLAKPKCTQCDWQRWPCFTLRLLTLPYLEHPDYDPAWTLTWAVT